MSRKEILRLLDLARLGIVHAPDDRIGYANAQAIQADNALLRKARAELSVDEERRDRAPGHQPGRLRTSGPPGI
jgi:hypothetical protein